MCLPSKVLIIPQITILYLNKNQSFACLSLHFLSIEAETLPGLWQDMKHK